MTIPRNLSFLAEGASSTGVLSVAKGGTGNITLTAGYIPYGNGTGAFNSSSTFYFDGANLAVGLTTTYGFKLAIGAGASPNGLLVSATGTGVYTNWSDGSATNSPAIGGIGNSLVFTTGAVTSAERMRIFQSGGVSIGNTTDPGATNLSVQGQLFVGATSTVASSYAGVAFNGASYNGFGLNDTAGASGAGYIYFQSNGTTIGSIARVGATSAVVYNTTSDQRLKTNIADASPVLDKLMSVKVRQFDWTEGDLHQDAGFIAQELEPVLSGIVTKGKTEDDIWQLDYSRLTPYLVKAVQEQQALIESLTQRIATLENK
jgi:hypothetical protein